MEASFWLPDGYTLDESDPDLLVVLRRYGLAFLMSALALALMLLLGPLMERSIFLLFVGSVALSALYGGLGPGLAAALLAVLGSAFFFMPPQYSMLVGLEEALALGVFLLVAMVVSGLVERHRMAEERLRILNEELERRIAERTVELEATNEELHHQIVHREALQRQLEHRAYHDPLTDLPNRMAFYEQLGRALSRAKRHGSKVALLLLDFDEFKLINDSLGHQAGDRMLVEIGQRLKRSLREVDMAARLGGDEFVVLMEDVADASEAVGAAKRCMRQMSTPFELRGQRLSATASIGIAIGDEEHPEELVGAADLAMYQAKSRGKGHSVVFEPNMGSHIR